MRGIVNLALVAVVGGALAFGAYLVLGLTCACGPAVAPTHGVVFSNPSLEGHPQRNTSEIWVAIISDVVSEEPFSAYEVGLYRGGRVLVEPVLLHTGLLGLSERVRFEFFDYGTMCLPTPCPPPEGPDGLLNENDYFRISFVEPGASYEIRVSWAPTGELAGAIAIET